MPNGEVVAAGTAPLVVYNPSEVFGMYADFLARQGGKIVCIRGIFHSGAGRPYGSFYYDSISDQYSGQELGITRERVRFDTRGVYREVFSDERIQATVKP